MGNFLIPAIALEGFSKRYRKGDQVGPITFDVPQGSTVGLLGLNGAGKTTILSYLAGLSRATAGSASILGVPVGSGADLKLGCAFESPSFYPHLTGAQNLRLLADVGRPADDLQIAALLAEVGMSEQADKHCRAYSLGMRQRLGLAVAMLGDVKVLLLDEPTAGLDPRAIRELREMLIRLNGRGMTILLSSHALNEVEGLCSSLAVIHRGTLRYVGGIGGFRALTRFILEEPIQAWIVLRREGIPAYMAPDGIFLIGQDAERGAAALARDGISVLPRVEEQLSLEDAFIIVTSDDPVVGS